MTTNRRPTGYVPLTVHEIDKDFVKNERRRAGGHRSEEDQSYDSGGRSSNRLKDPVCQWK